MTLPGRHQSWAEAEEVICRIVVIARHFHLNIEFLPSFARQTGKECDDVIVVANLDFKVCEASIQIVRT